MTGARRGVAGGADLAGPFREVRFRAERNATLDTLRWARKRRQPIPILMEVDVTAARAALREAREAGTGPSFTAWVIACVARAAAEHPRVHSLRRGARRIVVFEEVDVAVLVEREIPGGDPGYDGDRETLPMPVVIRGAHRKTPAEIHQEIQRARARPVSPGTAAIEGAPPAWVQAMFFRLPAWSRDLLLWRWLLRNPYRLKRTMGTVVVSSAAMSAPGALAWGVPVALHPLAVAVGGIARRGTGEEAPEVLALTIVFDHAVTDGAPVGRFAHRLIGLLTDARGLDGGTP